MTTRIEWAEASTCWVSVTDKGETMGDGRAVDSDHFGLCIGDELVVEGTAAELRHLAHRITSAVFPLGLFPDD